MPCKVASDFWFSATGSKSFCRKVKYEQQLEIVKRYVNPITIINSVFCRLYSNNSLNIYTIESAINSIINEAINSNKN